jgi:hypothetical protein
MQYGVGNPTPSGTTRVFSSPTQDIWFRVPAKMFGLEIIFRDIQGHVSNDQSCDKLSGKKD